MGGAGEKAKMKIEQRKQKKKIRAPKKLKKKNSCSDFSIGPIRGTV
jgi:hypothetical protein